MATKLSKEQKKYIDQAIRRLEKRYTEAVKMEKEYAEKFRIHAPELKMPSREEIYERIDTSKHNWSEQVKAMSSIDVYQPKSWGRIGASKKARATGGVESFDVDEAIKIMQAAKIGHEKSVKEGWKTYLSKKSSQDEVDEALRQMQIGRLKSLRNTIYIDKDTAKKYKRSPGEEKVTRRKVYLENLITKTESDLTGISPELKEEIASALQELIDKNGEGSLSDLAKANIEKYKEMYEDTTDKNIENTIKALENLDRGDFTQGLGKLVGYSMYNSQLEPLMIALGLDINKEYDGKSVASISDSLSKVPDKK